MTRRRSTAPRRRGTARRSARRRWLAIGGLVLLAGLIGGTGFWAWGRRSALLGEVIEFRVEPGIQPEALSEQLAQAGVLQQPKLFAWYLRMSRSGPALAPGVHLLRPGLNPAALAARLTRNRARPYAKLTIPEGYNQFQIAERLREREVSSAQAFLDACQDPALLAELGIPAASAEGYLFPATYDLFVDSDPALVVRTLVKEMSRRYRQIAERHSARVREREAAGWGMHQFIVLASIVEKEAGSREEDGNIASVFYNRLNDEGFRPRQMLQSDPTAGYGCLLARERVPSCARYTGIVTAAMLRDATNEYNTYKHPGLPPGPISNPSEAALEAVIDPPRTEYFFFVAGPGKRHVFSRTFGEHERAIAGPGVPPGETGALPGASLH
ncbi:MAG TPA: endolytic transglycosylase MltG [Polyangiaceae bacterium]|nr:endolytic transglycosylase MltG [Polyangiaceae bacterium]